MLGYQTFISVKPICFVMPSTGWKIQFPHTRNLMETVLQLKKIHVLHKVSIRKPEVYNVSFFSFYIYNLCPV